jgi:hypothetical protein
MPDGNRRSRDDDFFVGYLPTPPLVRRLLLRTTAAAGLISLVIAGSIAARQRDPGPGRWEADETKVFRGVFRAHPYPLLELDGLPSGQPRFMLVVDQGKTGGARLPAEADGATVQVRGQLLQRGELALLELADEPRPLTVLTPGRAAATPSRPSGESVELTGEIVDPKCYAGAMKPGEGKTHKACAALCLRGGIPPVFVTADWQRPLVLTDSDGRPLREQRMEQVIGVVGERVTLKGCRADREGISFLAIDPKSIRRQ